MFLTYIIWREPVKVSPKRGDPPQVYRSPSSNETILQGPALKYDSVQDSKIAVCNMIVARFRYDNLQDSDMTVCKRLWYTLQDDCLQGSDMV